MTEPPSTPNETQDLVNLATQELRAREQQRAERKPVDAAPSRQRGSLIGLLVAIPVLIVVVMTNFTDWSLRSLFETQPPAAVARVEAQNTLNALVGEVEAFRADYHQLPESLAEVGVPSLGKWTYSVRGDGRYSLAGRLYGQSVSFESPAPTQNR